MMLNKLTKELEKVFEVKVINEEGKLIVCGFDLSESENVSDTLHSIAIKMCNKIREYDVDCDYDVIGYEIEIEMFQEHTQK